MNESRVAATPKTVQQILKLGFDVIVEHDAGFKQVLKIRPLRLPVRKSAMRHKFGRRILFLKSMRRLMRKLP